MPFPTARPVVGYAIALQPITFMLESALRSEGRYFLATGFTCSFSVGTGDKLPDNPAIVKQKGEEVGRGG